MQLGSRSTRRRCASLPSYHDASASLAPHSPAYPGLSPHRARRGLDHLAGRGAAEAERRCASYALCYPPRGVDVWRRGGQGLSRPLHQGW
eukprot:scaffold57937_cov60-Phaeocystis_antarctica.AAC.6